MALKAGTVRLCATKSRIERHPLASAWLRSLLVVFEAAVFGAVFFGAVVFGMVVFGAVVFVAAVFGAVVFGAVVFGEVVFGAVVFGAAVLGAGCERRCFWIAIVMWNLSEGFSQTILLWRRGHINLR